MATKSDEQQRVEQLQRWYLEQQLDFDRQLIALRFRSIRHHLRRPHGLELGPADGAMTQLLLADLEQLTIVDGSQMLLDTIADDPRLTKICTLFEDFAPEARYDTVIMEHILEHVEDPVALLRHAAHWVTPSGVLIAGVPNGNSFHRLAAVKMGLLSHSCELNERDHELGHRRIYTPATFRADIEAAGLELIELGGVFFKPVSNRQIQEHWTPAMIEGFYQLGKDFPEHAAEIYAICRPAA